MKSALRLRLLALLAVTSLATPLPTLADVIYLRHDFAATFTNTPLQRIAGFFVDEVDSQTGEGRIYDIDVTVGSTHFNPSNAGGLIRTGLDGYSRIGGVLEGEFEATGGYTFESVTTETTDFSLVLFNPAVNPNSYLVYTLEGWGEVGAARAAFGELTFSTTQIFPSAVPEPATWAMWIGALACGAVKRRFYRNNPQA